jgi:hypothetical protein
VVEEFWRTQNIPGWMGFILKEKLKGLNVTIKAWNKEVYGALDTKITLLIEEIKDVDLRGELVGLTAEEIGKQKEHFSALWYLMKSKESMMIQRSRSRWLREGNANTN